MFTETVNLIESAHVKAACGGGDDSLTSDKFRVAASDSLINDKN